MIGFSWSNKTKGQILFQLWKTIICFTVGLKKEHVAYKGWQHIANPEGTQGTAHRCMSDPETLSKWKMEPWSPV